MKKNKIFLSITLLLIIVFLGTWLVYRNFIVTDNSLSIIKNKGVLVVGSALPFGVMEFWDENNKAVGVDVDVATEIANHLQLKLEFIDYDWDDLFVKLKNGEIDIAISSITITPERQKEMLFSDPYFRGGQVMVTRNNDQSIRGVNDLMDKKVAVQQDTTSYDEAKKYTTDSLIFTYLNFESTSNQDGIVNDLKNNKFDAIIVDYTEALNIIKKDSNLKIVGVPFTSEDYGIATKMGNNSLIKEINNLLKDMKKDGHLDEIKSKWTKF